MIKKILVFSLLAFLMLSFTARANEFDEYLKNQNKSYLAADDAFEKQKLNQQREFRKYRRKILYAYSQYKQKIAKYWGNDNIIVSNRHQLAEYHDNMKQREVVDFKTGEVNVEILINKDDEKNTTLIKQRLEKAIISTVTKAADKRSIIEIAKQPVVDATVKTETVPLLKGQVKLKSGEPVNENNARVFADEITKKSLQVKKQKGSDGITRIVATSHFNLVPDHIRVRAMQFKPAVVKYSKQYDVSQNLVYAVIETESFFNPTARSNVPAFGLMQLVPHYGAREAYRFVHQQDHVPSDSYLYNPENNIELGSAYLHVLYFNHMSEIKNKESRLLCAIAAYNTGPTNVYTAIIGKYRRSIYRKYAHWKDRAVRKINEMSPENLYSVLRHKLPYPETRSYIKKVRSRMDKYSRF